MESEADSAHQAFIRNKSSLEEFQRLLRTIIAQNRVDRSETKRRYGKEGTEAIINFKQFHAKVTSLFERYVKTQEIEAFFRKITNHPDAPVDWTEIFGWFQTDENNIDLQMDPENMVFFLSKRETIENATGVGKKRRDTIQCIVKVPLLDAVLTVSQKGTISLFNSQMKQHSCIHATEGSWFIGCDFLNQVKRVVAVANRSIVVWDFKCHRKNQDNYICIKPMDHCLLCVCTVISQDQSLKDDILVGDDAGFVSLISIGSKELSMHFSKSKTISYPVVLDSRTFKRFRRKLHNDWVVKVKYFPELNCFASSSPDSTHSLVLDNIKRIKDAGPVRVFSVPKGVTAFAYCVKAHMIATGGADKVIRLWHPNVVNKPMGKLFGHLYSIVDIAVNERDQHIISLSTARGFRVWDIYTLSLLQVFLDTEQGPGDRRINSMIFDNKHLRLLTGSCVLDVWPTTRMIQDTRQVPRSHDRPINALVYNQVFHQVLSICSGSVLKVWEMETGYQVYEIMDAHGPTIEVTAAAIDKNGFNFATGAYNGSLKMWDFGNGYEIKVLPPKKGYKDEEQGFCQLSYLRAVDSQHIIIALDMSGNIKMIQGKEDDPNLFVTMEFREDIGVWFRTLDPAQNRPMERNRYFPASQILADVKLDGISEQQATSHGRTIICFDTLKMEDYLFLATGSIDGEINMYSLGTSSVQHIYRRNAKDDISYTKLPGELDTQRINTILFILPKTVEALKTSSANTEFQDNSRCKEDVKTTEACSDEHSEKEDDRDVDKPCEPTGIDWCSVKLDGQTVSPLIVSGHENGHLYLWNTKGDLISKVLPSTKHPPIPLTALCTNICGNVLLAGNKEGYIILWTLDNFQGSHRKESKVLKQQLYWRAHSLKIISLFYEESKTVVVSASEDGSIRLWYSSNGNYIGYFGQRRTYKLTDQNEFIQPCDINEIPVHKKLDKNILGKKKNYEYPLIFDCDKFNSSINLDSVIKEQFPAGLSLDMKYFKSLSSPKVKRRSKAVEREFGAVFRTIPIYKVQSITCGSLPSCLQQSQESDHSITTTKTKVRSKVSKPCSEINKKPTVKAATQLPPIQAKH